MPREHQSLARDIFRELVEINTTHPFGSTAAAEAMAARLKGAGFEQVHVLGPKPAKANLVVRLTGTGKRRPVLFIAHLDVVEARKEDWTLDPFKLTEQQGYFYGRGTTDIKNEAADSVAFIRLSKFCERDLRHPRKKKVTSAFFFFCAFLRL
ncbi:MAG: M20/M25/M40 family metallo-hydrolase [Verrucomicrobiota bacterium]